MQITGFKPVIEKVDTREWDADDVHVKEPTAAEYAMFETMFNKINNPFIADEEKSLLYARIAYMFAVDANGKKLFSEDQVPYLAQGSSKPPRRIAMTVDRLSRLDTFEAKELEKN